MLCWALNSTLHHRAKYTSNNVPLQDYESGSLALGEHYTILNTAMAAGALVGVL